MRVLLFKYFIFMLIFSLHVFSMDQKIEEKEKQRAAYGALWSNETLNFTMDGITTGKNGNVKLIFQEKPNSKYNLSNYDVDNIHLMLKKEHNTIKQELNIAEEPNVVVAGCSLLVMYETKDDCNFACVYETLKLGKKTSGFISGFFGEEGKKLQNDFYQSITCSSESLSEKVIDRVNVIDLLHNAESRKNILKKFESSNRS